MSIPNKGYDVQSFQQATEFYIFVREANFQTGKSLDSIHRFYSSLGHSGSASHIGLESFGLDRDRLLTKIATHRFFNE